MGLGPALDRTPLADGSSSSLHESQSRLWENAVGRSLPFWRWFYPSLQQAFPPLAAAPQIRSDRAVNRVQRTFTRLDADETSYGLHVILRFELERKLVAGELAVSELPEAWNARFTELVGLDVPDDRQGVLQDVHWSVGLLGYFLDLSPRQRPLDSDLGARADGTAGPRCAEIERGDFSNLHSWLRENLYALGSKLTPAATIDHVAGGPADPDPYLAYLRAKLA